MAVLFQLYAILLLCSQTVLARPAEGIRDPVLGPVRRNVARSAPVCRAVPFSTTTTASSIQSTSNPTDPVSTSTSSDYPSTTTTDAVTISTSSAYSISPEPIMTTTSSTPDNTLTTATLSPTPTTSTTADISTTTTIDTTTTTLTTADTITTSTTTDTTTTSITTTTTSTTTDTTDTTTTSSTTEPTTTTSTDTATTTTTTTTTTDTTPTTTTTTTTSTTTTTTTTTTTFTTTTTTIALPDPTQRYYMMFSSPGNTVDGQYGEFSQATTDGSGNPVYAIKAAPSDPATNQQFQLNADGTLQSVDSNLNTVYAETINVPDPIWTWGQTAFTTYSGLAVFTDSCTIVPLATQPDQYVLTCSDSGDNGIPRYFEYDVTFPGIRHTTIPPVQQANTPIVIILVKVDY